MAVGEVDAIKLKISNRSKFAKAVIIAIMTIALVSIGFVLKSDQLSSDKEFSDIKSPILRVAPVKNSTPKVAAETQNDEIQTDKKQTVEEEEPSEVENEVEYVQYYSEQDAIDIAKVLYTECRGVSSVTEQACVVWTILNRVDEQQSSIYYIIREPNQYAFYEDTVIDEELLDLAFDVLKRWNCELNGETEVGRVLPKDYTFFYGSDGRNHFRNSFDGSYDIWDYSWGSPYES